MKDTTFAQVPEATRETARHDGGAGRNAPFWETKALDEMSRAEWESLCDGCGRCCLNKLEDWDTGQVVLTRVACRLLDGTTCRCTAYETRFEHVPECIDLTPDMVRDLSWLPHTCAYRLLSEGESLPDWHPLVSGDADSVHRAGISVRHATVSEDDVPVEDWEEHVIDWHSLDPDAGLK